MTRKIVDNDIDIDLSILKECEENMASLKIDMSAEHLMGDRETFELMKKNYVILNRRVKLLRQILFN